MLLRKAISKTGGVPRPCYASEGSSWPPPPPRHLLTKAMHAVNHKLPQAPCELYILPVVVYGQQLFPSQEGELWTEQRCWKKQSKIKQKNPNKPSREGNEAFWDGKEVCLHGLFTLIPAKQGRRHVRECVSGSLDRMKTLKFKCLVSIHNTL